MKTTELMVLFWRTADIYSNWYPARFQETSRLYSSTEQYMMWCKAMRFGCFELGDRILMEDRPKKLKELGRQVTGYSEAEWESERMPMMVRCCWLKFTQNKALGDELMATGRRIIAEASPVDAVWGIGLEESDPRALEVSSWQGRNLLGYALMEVRRLMREGDEAPKLEWLAGHRSS
jgi:ribA/ribD-fused uncharacterized protein